MGRSKTTVRQYGQNVAMEIEIEKYKQEKAKRKAIEAELNEDTKMRVEIQNFITAKAMQGQSKEAILKRIRFVFSNRKYEPYWHLFEKWVEQAVAKRASNQKQTLARDDKEER